MPSSQTQVEYVAHTRIGEKGRLTIPKQYRDELGLDTGAPVAVLRIGEGLLLISEQNRFRILCDSIASVLEHRQLSPADWLGAVSDRSRAARGTSSDSSRGGCSGAALRDHEPPRLAYHAQHRAFRTRCRTADRPSDRDTG